MQLEIKSHFVFVNKNEFSHFGRYLINPPLNIVVKLICSTLIFVACSVTA